MKLSAHSVLPVAALAAASLVPCRAQAVVSPNDRAVFEGSTSTSYPLGRYDGRFQQIHADLGPAGQTITEHSYRRDAIAERGDVTAFSSELEVVLSVAATTPDGASRTFTQNHGPAPVTVLARTRLSFPTTSRPGTDPAPAFEHRIPYGVPFVLPAGAPLCVDVTVYGNVTAQGPDRNFSAYLDAHEMPSDGSVVQPGFVTDPGCPAAGSTTPHDARFTFLRAPDGSLQLDIAARNGVPSTTVVPAYTALVLGLGPHPIVWPGNPACRLIPSVDATYTLPGPNDASGGWSGSIRNIPQITPGQRFLAQLASGSAAAGDLTFSDASVITVPPPPPATLPAVRIASGSNRASPTGTLARTATVTEFR